MEDFPWERETAWMKTEENMRQGWAARQIPDDLVEGAIEAARTAFDLVWFEQRPMDETFPAFLNAHMTKVMGEMGRRDMRILLLEREIRKLGGEVPPQRI